MQYNHDHDINFDIWSWYWCCFNDICTSCSGYHHDHDNDIWYLIMILILLWWYLHKLRWVDLQYHHYLMIIVIIDIWYLIMLSIFDDILKFDNFWYLMIILILHKENTFELDIDTCISFRGQNCIITMIMMLIDINVVWMICAPTVMGW